MEAAQILPLKHSESSLLEFQDPEKSKLSRWLVGLFQRTHSLSGQELYVQASRGYPYGQMSPKLCGRQ